MKKKKDKKAEKVELIKSEVNLVKYPFYTLDHDRFKSIKSKDVEIKIKLLEEQLTYQKTSWVKRLFKKV